MFLVIKCPGGVPNIWIIIVSMPPIDQIMFIYVLGGVSSFNLFLVKCAKNVRAEKAKGAFTISHIHFFVE